MDESGSPDALRVLEFDKLRSLLACFAQSEPGRAEVLRLAPLADRQEVGQRLAQAAQSMALHSTEGPVPVGGTPDLAELLSQVKVEGSFLASVELLKVRDAAEAARRCRSFLEARRQFPLLCELAEGLFPQAMLLREIRESIGPRGEILDGASFELAELRREMVSARGAIRRALEALLSDGSLASVFQERLITERGGRYVLPLRADCRGRIRGFIHDESASGQTLFIEPAQTLEDNNRLQSLLRQEKREEEKILKRLWTQVRRQSPELLSNQRILARLDLLGALAVFALKSKACIPQLEQEPGFHIRQACHPLLIFEPDGRLREARVIPVELRLAKGKDSLIISGPNTGGKTVALKTLGLFVLMARSGVPLPCLEGSRVYPFGGVFADIGDEQSIEQSLSTFSGHLKRLRGVLERADGQSLVLLDEAGTGTDPAEGGALCLAALDSLRARGAIVALTTHLNMVKGYAQLHPRVETAAVEFDPVTLAPTYRLHYGIPGASKAFAIARNLGIPEEVLERARGYLGEGETRGLELVEELNRLRAELEAQREEAASLLARAKSDREHRRKLLQELEAQKSAILEKARQKGEQALRKAKDRMQQSLQKADESLSARARAEAARDLGEAKEELSGLKTAPVRPHRVPRELDAGEWVKIPLLQAEGRVVSVRDGQAELDVAGKKMRLRIAQLEAFSPRRFEQAAPRTRVSSRIEREDFSPRLMLVGKHVEEALQALERFIDDALLCGARDLEIVHGSGEGILRRAVRDLLAGHRAVVRYHAADLKQGGDNVTLVELKG